MEINIQERKLGLNFLDSSEISICVWAPNALSVSLLIPAKNTELPMRKKDFGYWFIKCDQINEGDEYYFKILQSGEKEQGISDVEHFKRADPASIYQKDGVSGFSTAVNLKQFHWTDQNWKSIPLADYIIYELHVGTFSTKGNFKSVEEKLDYLIDLGITAIEIMPVSQFPGNRNWGYDGVYPFAVQNTYGGPKDLQHLVNACHEKGLAVILDVVYNHMGPEGNYFNDFGPYFTDKYQTPWGKAINFDDANCDPVRNYFIENALMWFRDFHIDALRIDAVHAIKDFSAKNILAEIKEYVNQLSHFTGKPYHLIVELDLNDNKYINSLKNKGYGMDAQWIDEFHHALRVTAGQPKDGYYSDFNGIEDLAKSLRDAYVYDGQYSSHRQKRFGIPAHENSGEQFVVFSQNHDQVGNRMLGERTSTLVSFEMLKLMAATVFCSPFLPLIFMGEEYAEKNPFQFFISHQDKDLMEAVREGRKKEFAAFHQEENIPDPQSEDTFQRSKLNWASLDEENHQIMFSYYKALIKLRKSYSTLAALNRKQLSVNTFTDKNCLVMERWGGTQKLLFILNFSAKEQNLSISVEHFNLVFNSSDRKWGGKHFESPTYSNQNITIYPESILIFCNTNV